MLLSNKGGGLSFKTVFEKLKFTGCCQSLFLQKILAAFEVLDPNKTGSVNTAEMKHILTNIGEKMSDAEFEEAAKIRDEIRKLESTELEITLNPKIRQYDVKNKLYPKGRSTMGMPGTKVTKKRDKKWKHKG